MMDVLDVSVTNMGGILQVDAIRRSKCRRTDMYI